MSPFIDRIPADQQQMHLDNMIEYFVERDYVLDDFHKDRKTCRFNIPYKIIVAYAKKPTNATNN